MAEIKMAQFSEEMEHRVNSIIGLVRRDHKIVAYMNELTRRYFTSNLGLKYYFKNVNKSAKNDITWKCQLKKEIKSVPSEIVPKKIIKSWSYENGFIAIGTVNQGEDFMQKLETGAADNNISSTGVARFMNVIATAGDTYLNMGWRDGASSANDSLAPQLANSLISSGVSISFNAIIFLYLSTIFKKETIKSQRD